MTDRQPFQRRISWASSPLPASSRSTIVSDDVTERIRALREEQNLLVWGSPTLVQTLMDHGFIDEYVLLVSPIVRARAGRGDEPLQRVARQDRRAARARRAAPAVDRDEAYLLGRRPTVTDGPFTEAKEFVGGYWITQARSKEEAIELASRAPIGDGRIEVRQIAEGSDFSPEVEEAARMSVVPPGQTSAE